MALQLIHLSGEVNLLFWLINLINLIMVYFSAIHLISKSINHLIILMLQNHSLTLKYCYLLYLSAFVRSIHLSILGFLPYLYTSSEKSELIVLLCLFGSFSLSHHMISLSRYLKMIELIVYFELILPLSLKAHTLKMVTFYMLINNPLRLIYM